MKLVFAVISLCLVATSVLGTVTCINGLTASLDFTENSVILKDCDGKRICQQSCSSSYVSCKSGKNIAKASTIPLASARYFVPSFPIDILVAGLDKLYDNTCIVHTKSRADLEHLFRVLRRSLRLRRRSPAIWKLVNRHDFKDYWTNQLEFCKKKVDGLLPADRSVIDFFNTKFTLNTTSFIKTLNETDAKVPLIEGSRDSPKVSQFINELAKWAVRTKYNRCPCAFINDAIVKGRYPDGKSASDMAKTYRPTWRNYQMAKQKMCLEKYPKVCKLTKLGHEMMSGDVLFNLMKSAIPVPPKQKTNKSKKANKNGKI